MDEYTERRVRKLEKLLIPLAEEWLERTDDKNSNYQSIKLRLEELKLEYKERSGREYESRS